MSDIHCLIVDDEPLARQLIAGYLENLHNWKISGICKNAVEAYEILMQQKIDVLFLDINMPVVSGLDFYRSLKHPPHLIFTTAYPEYAVEGFELEAVDYLVKPITFNRFLKAIERIQELVSGSIKKTGTPSESIADYLFVKHFSKLVKIRFADILFLEAQKDFVKFVTNREEILAGMTMKEAEELLPVSQFLRVQRSFIVSVPAITALFGNTIEIDVHQIPIGNNYKENVVKRIRGDI